MTKYHIKKTKNGYKVFIITEYRTHQVNINEELLGLRKIYFTYRDKDKKRLVNNWNGGKRLNDLLVTMEDNVDLTISDSYILCDLALSQAIANMINNVDNMINNVDNMINNAANMK